MTNMSIRAMACSLLTSPLFAAYGEATEPPAAVGASISNAQRATAAKKTVSNNPLCSKSVLGSFYWEIGNQDGILVSGSVGGRTGGATITADTVLNVASASKWLYSSYVVEKRGDQASDAPYLNFTSGYSNFRSTMCPADGTVADCRPGAMNVSEATGKVFHYDGGHMQRNAVDIGLGFLVNASLTTEIQSTIGADVDLEYTKPVVSGGVKISARNYSVFLRKLLLGSPMPLQMASLLGSRAVCTYPSATCNASSAIAIQEAWHYSLGHWVEDDPAFTPSSNFAYSSPGSFGFYPWVDVDRSLYGILAREDQSYVAQDDGYASVQCGRVIRLAWKTGVAQ